MRNRSQEMVEELMGLSQPELSRFAEVHGGIVLITPGSPYSRTPRPCYTPADLHAAVAAGLLEHRPLKFYPPEESFICRVYGLPVTVASR